MPMKRFFYFISTRYPGQGPTNPGDAHALGKEFPASAPQLIHGFCPSLMSPWNCLRLARVEPGILDKSTLSSPGSSPLGQPHGVANLRSSISSLTKQIVIEGY